jgi:7-carboxy-7-deazaguanine synthase
VCLALTDAFDFRRMQAVDFVTPLSPMLFAHLTRPHESFLQLDAALLDAVQARGFVVAVETNGTIAAPANIDWLTVSPKAGSDVVQRDGNELKLVYPQAGLAPEDVADWDFDRFYLQPMDGEHREENTRAAIRYCLEHPQWALSLQTHKVVGIP